MPQGALPSGYGIADQAMPEGLMAQLVYPLLQSDAAVTGVAMAERA